MSINEAALKKLREATFSPENFINTMEQMLGIQEMMGATGDIQIPIDYQVAGEKVVTGEKIPFIIIGLRNVEPMEEEVEKIDTTEMTADEYRHLRAEHPKLLGLEE
jgi:hypothetical protein